MSARRVGHGREQLPAALLEALRVPPHGVHTAGAGLVDADSALAERERDVLDLLRRAGDDHQTVALQGADMGGRLDPRHRRPVHHGQLGLQERRVGVDVVPDRVDVLGLLVVRGRHDRLGGAGLQLRSRGRDAEEDEPGGRVVGGGADKRLVVVDDQRKGIDARLQIDGLRDDQRTPRADPGGQEAHGGRGQVVLPRIQEVFALLGAIRERVRARVDRDVEALQPRELYAGGADVDVRVVGQPVDVGGSARVPLDVVFVLRTEHERIDQGARAGPQDRDAEVHEGLVDVDVIEVLGSVLVHRRPGVVRRRTERRERATVQRDLARPGRGVARLQPLQLHCRHGAQRRALDQEVVGDTALHAVLRQDDEAVVLAGARVGGGTDDDRDRDVAPGRECDHARHIDLDTGRLRLRGERHRPVAGSVPCVGHHHEHRRALGPRRDVDLLERERLWVGEDLGIVCRQHIREPRTFEQHGSLLRARGVAPGPRPSTSARTDLPRRPARVLLEEQRGRARDVRGRHRGSGEDGERLAGRRGRRGGENVEPWRRHIRLQHVPEVGRPGRREARDRACAVGLDLLNRAGDANRRPAAVRCQVRAQELAVQVGDHPGRDRQWDRNGIRLAEAIVDEDQSDRAARHRPLRLRDERADAARGENDLARHGVLRQRSQAGVRIARGAAEVRFDRLAVGAQYRRHVDDLLVEGRPRARQLRATRALDRNGAERERPADDGESRSEHVRVRGRGDRHRVRSRSGRAGGAEAEVLTVVACGDHRHHARERGVVDRLVHRVVRRVGLRPAAREVDDVHAVGDRRFEGVDDLGRVRLVAERGGDGEDAVVADPGLGRDAREVCHLGVVAAGRSRRVLIACRDPRDVRAVRFGLVERLRARRVPHRAGKHPGHDHLRRRELRISLREACRIREPRGVEERARRVDAGVDDRDLHALALLTRCSFEIGGMDHARAAVHRRRVREARIDLRDRSNAQQLGQRPRWKLDGEAVEQDGEVLLDPCLRDRRAHLGRGGALEPGELREVRDGAGGVHVEVVRARGGEHRALGGPRRERRRCETDDHAGEAAGVSSRDMNHAGADARQRGLADRAADRGQGSRGRRRRDEPEHRREHQQATQGSAH